MNRKTPAFALRGKRAPLSFFLVLAFIATYLLQPVYAQSNYTMYDLTFLPTRVADHLGITVFDAGIICSGILMLICVLPIAIVVRSKKASWIPEMAMVLIIMGFCVSVEWLPVFFMVVFCMLIALLFAGKSGKWITSR